MVKQIFLGRDLNQIQRALIDSQQIASTASDYDTAWQQLAKNIYLASHQDPNHVDAPLNAILKDAGVEVRSTPPGTPQAPPTDTTAPSPSTFSLPSVPPKAPTP
jgi:hypothetical protein